ncbi:hypothetical protein Acr_08g0003420 [Actinidia rufa]|uniref:F-box domain-containing protein n=1 Tax=Actinidia rufa TaxID=165716 RepID=A0A7J0F0F3_9ERIC|nr:hypothetical protein Acr_08g0003420 [Actinidia rufa]
MGCCGDEDADDILQPLQPETTPNETLLGLSPSAATATHGGDASVLSPMNFEALVCRDMLRTVFEKLTVADLARAACVCRLWSSVASVREMQTRAFMAPWKLKDVVGNPSSGGFWRANGLGRFAISHRLVRGDTVASLAVKYCVQVPLSLL